eukprot:4739237-Pleurochrysis_carterae.AAC.1
MALPASSIMRIAKGKLPDGVMINKDAKLAFSKATSIFILYLSTILERVQRLVPGCKSLAFFPDAAAPATSQRRASAPPSQRRCGSPLAQHDSTPFRRCNITLCSLCSA